jgi:hypothetical protein
MMKQTATRLVPPRRLSTPTCCLLPHPSSAAALLLSLPHIYTARQPPDQKLTAASAAATAAPAPSTAREERSTALTSSGVDLSAWLPYE